MTDTMLAARRAICGNCPSQAGCPAVAKADQDTQQRPRRLWPSYGSQAGGLPSASGYTISGPSTGCRGCGR